MPISWKGVIRAGLGAGLLFIVLQMLLLEELTEHGLWTQPRLIATLALGPGAAPPPKDFDLAIVTVGLLVHFLLSLLLALILGAMLSLTGADLVRSAVAGLVFGLLVYVGGYYVFTALFPALEQGRSGVTLFNHLVYGAALGGLYKAASAPADVPQRA